MDDPVWIEHVVFPLVMMGMTTLAGVGVYRIVVRWIDRKHERQLVEAQQGAGGQDTARLQARVEALEAVAERVQELEERVDFAERLLTQQRERNVLPSGE
jgi:hypothetical protein